MKRKVMLIMDEPLDCTDCPLTDLSSMTGDKLCLASNKRWIETQNEYKKPDWCRLRPLPDREKANDGSNAEFKMIDEAWTSGFNACLAEITGETE